LSGVCTEEHVVKFQNGYRAKMKILGRRLQSGQRHDDFNVALSGIEIDGDFASGGPVLPIRFRRLLDLGQLPCLQQFKWTLVSQSRVAAKEECCLHPGITSGQHSQDIFEPWNYARLGELPGRVAVPLGPAVSPRRFPELRRFSTAWRVIPRTPATCSPVRLPPFSLRS
jgi:hypothetical protein